ncbi:hypothetical protein BST81_09710 [Leptolyngbya sp. 'hensonii']|uniref:sirohydrochlorin chelatase n=1 Tax=Leptolyngbya sp. 'hensonii' TaxID=1922337 RepID=UPI00094F82D0|nr:sirohydrochlorin chelatase [Leptolyngbya sp. 'hensonii']OLP18560.1 hypothetical protein BST81_09710 [Leptolyngbya sp. 'hensonii']
MVCDYQGAAGHPFLRFDSALVLVFHGSRDPRPQAAMEKLAHLLQQRLAVPIPIGIAALELATQPLHWQLYEFAAVAAAQGFDRLQIVPLFLLPGVHVMEDIPTELALTQQILKQKITLELRPYLGSHPQLAPLLAAQIPDSTQNRILLAHGSCRPGGNQSVATLADQLNALPAYWSVPPTLKTRLEELVQQDQRQVTIVPYFLFRGGITDAIAQMVEQLAEEFPSLTLQLANPIGPTPELLQRVLDLLAPRPTLNDTPV